MPESQKINFFYKHEIAKYLIELGIFALLAVVVLGIMLIFMFGYFLLFLISFPALILAFLLIYRYYYLPRKSTTYKIVQ